MRQSKRGQVDPFIVMDVMQAAANAEAAGRHIIHMEVGQPGTPAPAGARRALAAALEQPLGYTVALGLPELRQGIADLYRRWYGVDLDPARVVITPGSSGAFILAFSALFDAGDRVAMGYPGYPSYRQILRAMSLEPMGILTRAEDRYQPRPGDLPDAQGLILASPGNPSGTVLTRDELRALTDAAAARNMAVISDEIYHGLSYGERCASALEVTDEVFVINSFSKYFSMTGWRIGWMVVPPSHLRTVERLAQNMFICPPHASQVAALAALQCESEADANRAVYAENRRLMMQELPKAGFDRIAPPEGAFYIYADVSHLTDDSVQFAAEILEHAGVAVTPGLDFDPERGRQTLRFSYARATADIAEGLRRLTEYMSCR
ncbi:pyridoxal phosphate-dependent aminotransferase [Paracoccus sp. (in: a-proteobacteria)]|uniref:pyridoxal phosphate-dependent aminotransferase n=1 Tax=Paracoccus sp. TaxID=267 RepID=UPI0026DF7B6B|nr:aminotransferase class I/II-fold pyridoxal phosphate-dependent enzyme [Paracoccus sp. (in: a-proteobacteria)]MDO5646866.1 aminotransferase class I/II-fold pyridoxal phosphate-dependent enzyme [Paracoccus sp. (in: a-proteobacteria)]